MNNIMKKTPEQIGYYILRKYLHIRITEDEWRKCWQFLKFVVVGLSNNIVYYIFYVIFIMAEVGYLFANGAAFTISIVNSFYWNNKYVFEKKGKSKRKAALMFIKTFICYSVTGIVLSNVLMIIWIEKLGIHQILAPVINLVITTPVNYVLNKFWAYKDSEKNNGT